MELNFKEIAGKAAAYGKKSNFNLDYSENSIEAVDSILGSYYEHFTEYDGKDGEETLWNIAVHFGIYLGETMLELWLGEKGFSWYIDDGLPILRDDTNTQISPITKVHKRMLNGPCDNVKSFCDVALSFVNGELPLPAHKAFRAVSVELPSGEKVENVPYRDIDSYIMLVENGSEDFLILNSHDGFLQFYGVNNQFVAEMRINFPNSGFRTFSIINKDNMHLEERVELITPYGRYMPVIREIISLELLKTVVGKYYENITTEDFLKEVPYTETTKEHKRSMGLTE